MVIRMAHRWAFEYAGECAGKKPSELFDEFARGKHFTDRTGDVKYHQGFSSNFMTELTVLFIAVSI